MAMLDAYATAAEYRSRVNMTDTSSDAEILVQLKAASRMLERELRVAVGAFNDGTAAEARYFRAEVSGSSVLRLRDERGMQHYIQAIDTDGVAVDTDNDGDYDYTVDPAGETWIVARPVNAATLSEPWTTLELLGRSAATFTTWPTGSKSVRVTGTWGWQDVPGLIKELVVKMTRDIRDSEEAGAAGSLAGVALKTDTWRLWLSAKQQFGEPTVVFA